MKKPRSRSIEKLAKAAFEQAAETVIDRAQRTGTPVLLWKNGRVHAVKPEETEFARKLKVKKRRMSSRQRPR